MMQDIREGNEGYADYSLDGKQLLPPMCRWVEGGWCARAYGGGHGVFCGNGTPGKLLFIGVSCKRVASDMVITT
jgi:hypothetical protein